jgi:hypothetical protein
MIKQNSVAKIKIKIKVTLPNNLFIMLSPSDITILRQMDSQSRSIINLAWLRAAAQARYDPWLVCVGVCES